MSNARLLNMTDRSLGKPSKCTVRAEAIPRPGDAGSAILVIVRNRAAFSPLGVRFHHRLCLRRPEYAMSMENAAKRRATLLRPQITESETGLETF